MHPSGLWGHDRRVGNRWGNEGPPPEAYSRVTDPGKYAALHEIAYDVVAEFEHRYDVVRADTTELSDRAPDGITRPVAVLTLTPPDPGASAVAVVMDPFPGLIVRSGRSRQVHVPSCGCDACDETVEDCTAQLREHLTDIAEYGFSERLVFEDGYWWQEGRQPGPGGESWGRGRLSGEQVPRQRALIPEGGYTCLPWTQRTNDPS